MATISVPDYDFSGFYYPEVFAALLKFTRVNAPELTSESEYETHIQMLRAFALVAHLNNTRLDIVANELLVDSAQLRQSLVKLFRLIDVELGSATPSTVEEVIMLSAVQNLNLSIYIPKFSRFSTEDDEDQVVFEVTEDLPLARTDEVGHVYGATLDHEGTSGSVDSNLPTQFTITTGVFLASDVGKTISFWNCQRTNGGIFIVSDYIDSNNIEVSGTNFVTEASIGWALFSFTADFATEANSLILDFSPWGTGLFTTSADAGHYLYVGHVNIQWIATSFTYTTPGDKLLGVWEYYDPTYGVEYPSSVTDLGSTIEFIADSLLGTVDRQLALVQVTYNLTGISEFHLSSWDGSNNIVTTRSLLGQTVVDVNPLNYSIKSDWIPLPDQVDGTSNLSVAGDVEYSYPSTPDNRWQKATVNQSEAYYVRYRLLGLDLLLGPATPPTINRARIDEEEQYFPFELLQGESINNEVLGDSNGQIGQRFLTQLFPVFDGSEVVEVDETSTGNWIEWAIVSNFVSSGENDRHLVIQKDDTGFATVIFGNGEFGKIPSSGTENIRISYRVGGDENGNVGSNTITEAIDGVPFVSAMGNPMPAIGWKVRDGGTNADLDRVKDEGPASIRNQGKAVTPDDTARVAVNDYVTEAGSSLIARAFSIEEAYGPKTIELVVVGTGGGYLTPEQIEDVDTFFNGDRYSIPPVEGVLLMNHALTTVNYSPRSVDVTVHVIGTGLVIEQIQNAIRAYLDPLSEDEDGDYVHDFGGELAVVKLDCAINDISSNIKDIVRTVPAANVTFGPRQLPVPGTITVTIASP